MSAECGPAHDIADGEDVCACGMVEYHYLGAEPTVSAGCPSELGTVCKAAECPVHYGRRRGTEPITCRGDTVTYDGVLCHENGDCPGHPIPAARIEAACEVMHDAYEVAAVGAGWKTQRVSQKPWADVPEANKTTMRAAVKALLDWLDS